ncbi:MAG: hypothetical protein F4X65_05750 [Chloroflexi bacterium]|nr:hypothetical protein [Chloroflexota bacterium]
MEALTILGIAFVMAFVISIYGFLIFFIYKLGKLTEAMNNIPGEVRRGLDSRATSPRLEQ